MARRRRLDAEAAALLFAPVIGGRASHACHLATDGALALGLNPLLLGEGALNGHFDVLCGRAPDRRVGAVAASIRPSGASRPALRSGSRSSGSSSLPSSCKTPQSVHRGGDRVSLSCWRRWLGRVRPVDPVSGAGQFAIRWRGNESVLGVLEYLSRALFEPGLAELVVARRSWPWPCSGSASPWSTEGFRL